MREPEAATTSEARRMPLGDVCTPDQCDFVDSGNQHEFDEVVEDPDQYIRGLYYPTYIGELIAERYRIEHKLGHGGSSVVWMAHDVISKRDVALKIMVSRTSGEREWHMQAEIGRTVSDTSRLLIYQHTFMIPGSHDNRNHRVLVFPLQGPNLRDHAREKPIATRMWAAKQLLQALKALHGGGFIHRDLNSADVMFGLQPLDSDNATTKYQYIGHPRKMLLPPTQWKQGELVIPMTAQKELVRDDILLGDFGLAIQVGTPVAQKVQSPAIYCAPERMHGMDPSFASDMWSYMCIFAELYGQYPLFSGSGNSNVISSIVNTLGPLPVQWTSLYRAGGSYEPAWYDQERDFDAHLRLENRIPSIRPDITAEEQRLVLYIFRWGFSYLPEHRPTAAQLLDDISFKELMAIYGL